MATMHAVPIQTGRVKLMAKHIANTTKYIPNAHQVSARLIENHRLMLAAAMGSSVNRCRQRPLLH